MTRDRYPINMTELGDSYQYMPWALGENRLALLQHDILSNFDGAAYVVFQGSQLQACGIKLSANDSIKVALNPSGSVEPASIRPYSIYLAPGASIMEPHRYCLHFLPGSGQ